MIKKITNLFAAFICLSQMSAFAQPGVTPQYPYFQAFDSLAPFQSIEGQAGWLNGNFFGVDPSTVSVYAARGIDGTYAMSAAVNDFLTTDSILTPLIGDLIATSEISFYYRIVTTNGNLPQTLSNNGGIKLSILPYVGSTPEPEQEIYRVSAGNHIDSSGFVKVTSSLSAFAGKTAYFKFSYYLGSPGEDYILDIDSLVINHPIVTALNNLNSSHVDIIMNGDNQISLKNNSAASLSLVQIFDINGKLILNTQLKSNINIDTSQWNKGVYLVHIMDQNKSFTKKIIVR
jgi:hypothetical protein